MRTRSLRLHQLLSATPWRRLSWKSSMILLGLLLCTGFLAFGFSNDVSDIELTCSHSTVHVGRTDVTITLAADVAGTMDIDGTITLKRIDTSPEQTVATFATNNPPGHGSVATHLGEGIIPNALGSYQYRAYGQKYDGSAVQSQVVTIAVTNTTPVAGADAKSTTVNTPLTFPVSDLLANDTDADSDTLVVNAVSANSLLSGTVALVSGQVTYTPATNYTGTDSFTYTLQDDHGATATGTVTVSVGTTMIGTGLRADYFDNADLTDLKTTRTDTQVNFDWGTSIPEGTALTSAESFSVRWSGKVQPSYSEEYTFYTLSEGGVRLWVDGQLLIDQWDTTGVNSCSSTISLTAGQQYPVTLEYQHVSGNASVALRWSSASQVEEVILQQHLNANIAPTVSLTRPQDSTVITAGEPLYLTATASDSDGAISKVEFYQGSTKLGEDTDGSNGWAYSWINIPVGSYTVTAHAYDNNHVQSSSQVIHIVANPYTGVVSVTLDSTVETTIPPDCEQIFPITLAGTSDQDVVWSVLEDDGGSIQPDGTYTAPIIPGIYHLIARSVADPTASETITVQIQDGAPLPTICKRNVKVLPDDGSVEVLEYTPDTLQLRGNFPPIAVGDVIIGDTEDVFCKVLSVTTESDIVVATITTPKLTDIFEQSEEDFTDIILPEEMTFTPKCPGVTITNTPTEPRQINLLRSLMFNANSATETTWGIDANFDFGSINIEDIKLESHIHWKIKYGICYGFDGYIKPIIQQKTTLNSMELSESLSRSYLDLAVLRKIPVLGTCLDWAGGRITKFVKKVIPIPLNFTGDISAEISATAQATWGTVCEATVAPRIDYGFNGANLVNPVSFNFSSEITNYTATDTGLLTFGKVEFSPITLSIGVAFGKYDVELGVTGSLKCPKFEVSKGTKTWTMDHEEFYSALGSSVGLNLSILGDLPFGIEVPIWEHDFKDYFRHDFYSRDIPGSRIVYDNSGSCSPSNIYISSLSGAYNQVIGQGHSPTMNPAGDRIAYVRTDSEGYQSLFCLRFIFNAEGQTYSVNEVQLTHHMNVMMPKFRSANPETGLNSNLILFTLLQNGHGYLCKIDSASPDAVSIIPAGGADYFFPSMSSDGTRITYCGCSNGQWFIGVMNSDGSDNRILRNIYSDSRPTFSPDGTLIALESGATSIILIDSEDGSLQDNTLGGGLYPIFFPNGQSICYLSGYYINTIYRTHAVGGVGTPIMSADTSGFSLWGPTRSSDAAPNLATPLPLFSTDEDTSVTLPITDYYSDPDGDYFWVQEVKLVSPDCGTVHRNGVSIVYTPAQNFIGGATIKFRLSDGQKATDWLNVNVYVDPVDDPPIVTVTGNTTISQGESTTLTFTINNFDYDPTDPEPTSFLNINSNSISGDNGYHFVSAAPLGTCTITYTPPEGFFGDATIYYTAEDSDTAVTTGTITIRVNQ